MDKESLIFTDPEKPANKNAKRKIIVGRIFLLVFFVWIFLFSIDSLDNTFNRISIITAGVLLIVNFVSPFIGFLLAALIIIFMITVTIYSDWHMWSETGVFDPLFTILPTAFLSLMATSFIIAAIAARKMRKLK